MKTDEKVSQEAFDVQDKMTNKRINSNSLERTASLACAGLLALEAEAWTIVSEGDTKGIPELVNYGMQNAALAGYAFSAALVIGSGYYFTREISKGLRSQSRQI